MTPEFTPNDAGATEQAFRDPRRLKAHAGFQPPGQAVGRVHCMPMTDTLTWPFPLTRTHCGIGLGNGQFGALVWGMDRLHITVNRADFWDHRGGDKLLEGTTYERLKQAYDPTDRTAMNDAFVREPRAQGVLRSSRLPLGRFELELAAGYRLSQAVLYLDCGRLVIRVQTPEGDTVPALVLALSTDLDVLYIEDKRGVLQHVQPRPAWEWVGEQLAEYDFRPPSDIAEDDLRGWVQTCPDDPAAAALCKRLDDGLLISTCRGGTVQDTSASARAIIDRFERDRGHYLLSHDQWWRGFWQRVPEVQLPSDFFNRQLAYSLFRFAGATHPGSSHPSGLQGPWIEEYRIAPWSGDYHFNVNIQQIYTLAFASNNLEHLLPLFDMLESESFQHVMRSNANVMFGIDDGLLLTHAVDDRGYQCGGISAGSTIDHAVSGWTAQLYWLYYRYTLDTDFLRERAYPFMLGVMRCYEEMLEERDGKLSIPISISAEYGATFEGGTFQNVGPDPSYQLACLHMLADALLQTTSILQLPQRPRWTEIQKELPPYTLIGPEGEERIAIWDGQDLDVCHRHHSHLACIYPFDSLGEMTPEKQRVIDNSIDHWILKGMGQWSEWCMPWAAIIQSRLGFADAPLVLLKLWRDVFINEGMMTVYLPRFRGITAHRRADMLKPKDTNEIMQLDGMMAGATAIYEMLVHERRGTVRVFPAVSERWQEVTFRNIRVPGAFLVSGERRGGQTREVSVRSLCGGALNLDIPDRREMVLVRGSQRTTITLPATLELSRGEVIQLRANDA